MQLHQWNKLFYKDIFRMKEQWATIIRVTKDTRVLSYIISEDLARHITRAMHKGELREHLKGVLFKFAIQTCFSSGFCVLIELAVLYRINSCDTVLCFSYALTQFIRI